MTVDYLGVYGVCLKDNRVLSIKKTTGPYKNRYDLPGGSQKHKEGFTETLVREYLEETGCSVIGVQTVPEDQTHRYGVIAPKGQDGHLYEVETFVEKPAPGTAPSNQAIMGRYVLNPGIFKHLAKKQVGVGGEVQLTDAIQMLNEEENVYAYDFQGKRYDVGETIGFVKTTIDFALKSDLKDDLVPYLKAKLAELE